MSSGGGRAGSSGDAVGATVHVLGPANDPRSQPAARRLEDAVQNSRAQSSPSRSLGTGSASGAAGGGSVAGDGQGDGAPVAGAAAGAHNAGDDDDDDDDEDVNNTAPGAGAAAAAPGPAAARGGASRARAAKLFSTFRNKQDRNLIVQCYYIWGATSAPLASVQDGTSSSPWVRFGFSPRRYEVAIVSSNGLSWAELDARCPWHVALSAPTSVGGCAI